MTPLSTPAAQGTVAPCPFCGSPAKMIACMGAWNVNGYEPDGRRIACSADGCYIAGKPFYGEGMEEAATAWWNRRASPSPEALPASGVEGVPDDPFCPFKIGDVLVCAKPTNFHKVGDVVVVEALSRRYQGDAKPFWVSLIGKPGHYGWSSFRRASSTEIAAALSSAPAPEDR